MQAHGIQRVVDGHPVEHLGTATDCSVYNLGLIGISWDNTTDHKHSQILLGGRSQLPKTHIYINIHMYSLVFYIHI